MKRYFSGATKGKVGGRQIMQVLLGRNICGHVINEDVVEELNRLGRRMWLSEVQSEEDGINLQMEENPAEDTESAEDGIVLRKTSVKAK
jgi:hypothetical protein